MITVVNKYYLVKVQCKNIGSPFPPSGLTFFDNNIPPPKYEGK
jgi:hypothetical protein